MTRVAGKDEGSTVCGWAGAAAVGLATVGALAAPTFADDGSEGLPEVPDRVGTEQAARVELALEVGGDTPRPGQEFTLRATVANNGSGPVEGALLAQHVPEALEVIEVNGDGVVKDGIVNWQIAVPEGEESVYAVRVRALAEAEGNERMMSTVCLLLDRDTEPAACASDTVVVTEETMASRASELMGRGGLLRATGAALVMGLGWLLWRRRGVLRQG